MKLPLALVCSTALINAAAVDNQTSFEGPSSNSSMDISNFPTCSNTNDTNCIIYERGQEVTVRVVGKNQFGAIMPIASKIFEGITSMDLGGIINGIKNIFGGSTEHFSKKIHEDDRVALKQSSELYQSIGLLFSGMIKEEQELHTQVLNRMEQTEMKENEILTELVQSVIETKVYQFYLLCIQAGFYGFISLVFDINFVRLQ